MEKKKSCKINIYREKCVIFHYALSESVLVKQTGTILIKKRFLLTVCYSYAVQSFISFIPLPPFGSTAAHYGGV
jgi:hypothetical protein